MHTKKNGLRIGLGSLATVAAVAGVAFGVGTSGGATSATAASENPISASVSTRFSALAEVPQGSKAGEELRARLSPATLARISGASWANVVSVTPENGTAERKVWMVPVGDELCLFSPLEGGGTGGSCGPARDTNGNGPALYVGAGPGEKGKDVLVAVAVPDEAKAPVVTGAGDASGAMTAHSNVAAAVLPTEGELQVGGTTADLGFVGDVRQAPAK